MIMNLLLIIMTNINSNKYCSFLIIDEKFSMKVYILRHSIYVEVYNTIYLSIDIDELCDRTDDIYII